MSAFATREARRVLRQRIRLQPAFIDEIEELLREHEVVPKPRRHLSMGLRDRDDEWIIASATAGRADVLVTGDRDLLEIVARASLPILTPRGFWERVRRRGR